MAKNTKNGKKYKKMAKNTKNDITSTPAPEEWSYRSSRPYITPGIYERNLTNDKVIVEFQIFRV